MSATKGKKKKRSTQNQGADPQGGDEALVEGMSMAAAVLKNDTESMSRLVESFLPNSQGVQIENLVISKSAGEAFTGGRSTPVYHIRCDVVRMVQNDKRASKRRYFVVKLVLMPNTHDTTNDGMEDEISSIPYSLWLKRESYAVERRFYDCAAPRLRQNLPGRDNALTIPKLLGSDRNGSRPWPAVCWIMNDVSQAGFPIHPEFLSPHQAKAALCWIAAFHALFWGESDDGSSSWRRDLWDRSGFWTPKRQQNDKDNNRNQPCAPVRVAGLAQQWGKTVKWLEGKYPTAITPQTRGLGKRLEAAAGPISEFLATQSQKGSLGTLVHGDYKAANMFFRDSHENEEQAPTLENVAVLDFQFCGLGLGAEDVAYLLFPDARGDYFDVESDLLECYHDELVSHLILQQKGGPSTLPFESFLAYYELGRIDLLRYLMVEKGWVGSNKGDARLVAALEATLDRIDGGQPLSSDDKGRCLDALSNFVGQNL